MTVTPEFVHLAASEQAASTVRETLIRLGRHETVIGMWDCFAEGPLVDVDTTAASRIEWYRRIDPSLRDEVLPRADMALWDSVHARSANVMLWHGPHPMERVFALRACWHLRNQPERVFEVALSGTAKGALPAFYNAVALAGAKLVQHWERRAKVVDVAERAKQWEHLRAQPGDWIRLVDGEAIVQLPVTSLDSALVDAAKRRDWTDSRMVVGTVIAAHPVGLALMRWRIRELLRAGMLEGRGDPNDIGLPAEVRRPEGG